MTPHQQLADITLRLLCEVPNQVGIRYPRYLSLPSSNNLDSKVAHPNKEHAASLGRTPYTKLKVVKGIFAIQVERLDFKAAW